MSAYDETWIAELKKQTECTKDFLCESNGFKDLCRVKPTAGKQFLVCLEQAYCSYRVSFGETNYCRCPMRDYLNRNE